MEDLSKRFEDLEKRVDDLEKIVNDRTTWHEENNTAEPKVSRPSE